MGVHGLWQLLKPTGQPVTLDSLEGKVLAVDISIWLHQAVRGMRDAEGNLVNNAHLVTLLHRICKLLYFRIKPIFVFDGSVPELKRQTMAARRKRKEFALDKSDQATEQILRNYMKVHAVDTVLGKKKKSVKKVRIPRVGNKADAAPNMYILPPLPDSTEESLRREEEEDDDIWVQHQHQRSFLAEHYQEIGSIDVHSEDFKSLPPEIQHELIEEFLERNKHNSWAKKNILPKEATEFSDFQLNKLLNKSRLNQRLENIREEMSRRNSGEIASILDIETKSIEARRIVSEDTQHYILVKTQKQKTPLKVVEDEFKPSGSKDLMEAEEVGRSSKSLSNIDTVDLTKEEKSKGPITAEDLERAIQAVFDNQKAKMLEKNLTGYPSNTSEYNVMKTLPDGLLERTISKTPFTDPFSNNSGVDIRKPEDNPDIEIMVTDKPEDMDDVNNCQISKISAMSSASVLQNVDVVDLTKEIPTQENNDDQIKEDRDIDVITRSTIHAGSIIDGEKNQELEVENQVTSVIGNDHVESEDSKIYHKTLDLRHEDEPRNEMKEKSFEVNEEEDGAESEGDFIEVSFDPAQARGNDELFPAEIFMQSNHVSDEAPSQDHITSNEDEIIKPNFSQINREQIAELQRNEEEMMAVISTEREKSIKEWKDMNTSDVSEMENALTQERATLQNERQRQQRIGASVTDQMYAESKELLELFGIPYIVSPQEAEAQCAFLDLSDQTHGSITEDSDIWLFGGHRVYKNFFTKDKDVEFYESSNFESHLFLDRMKLINLALLLGCDYTDGIDGVGCITAMEILSEFPGKDIDGLKNFRAWWDANAGNWNPPVETKIKSQLRKLHLTSAFPQEAVMKAFMSPQVEESAEEFTWGIPDLDSIRGFALERLSWNTNKTDENVLPVLKRISEKSIQRPITSFFSHATGQQRSIQSKRLKRVLKKFQQAPSDSDEEEEIPKKSSIGKRKTVDKKEEEPQIKRKTTDGVNKEGFTKKVQNGKQKKGRQSKQKLKLSDIRRKPLGTKVESYWEESDSDEMDANNKSKAKESTNSAKHVQWRGPVLSESSSDSD